MTNVLVDFHHSGLLHSLLLLGKRLGWTVYLPKGEAWWENWYWVFGRSTYNDDRLARQFLYDPPAYDPEFPDTFIPSVTLDEAKAMDWAYVICSAQDNQPGYAMFAREVGAKYVVQVGNTGQEVDWQLQPIALISAEAVLRGKGIYYHQEMDPVAYIPPTETRTAASFVNCMPSMGHCYSLLQSSVTPVAMYGIDSEVIKPYSRLVEMMGQVGWGWHDKAQGDGFGHVIHSWAAVGRPLIGHASHYRGRMAEPFWEDGVTCIDLDKHPIPEVDEMVATMDPDTHRTMCEAIRSRFDAIDWDGEAEAIRELLA